MTPAIEVYYQLDRGAQGAVYVAKVAEYEGFQAVKVAMQPGGMTAQALRELKERFHRECALQGTLGIYDSIVKAQENGTTPDGIPYLVMELIRGQTLDALLGRRPEPGSLNPTRPEPMEPRRAVRILRGICVAVDAMHFHRIIHRDIKPGNIFLLNDNNGQDRVKVGDLGLAWAQERGRMRSPDPLPNGSPLYMSPEQVLCSDTQGPPSDVYSIGVVAYEMLTGRMPYSITESLLLRHLRVGGIDIVPELRGKYFAGWLRAHVYAELFPPEAANPSIPPELSRIIVACLQRDMDERPQRVSELAERLERAESAILAHHERMINKLGAARRRMLGTVERLEAFNARIRPAVDQLCTARRRLGELPQAHTFRERTATELAEAMDQVEALARQNEEVIAAVEGDQNRQIARVQELEDERAALRAQRDELRQQVARLQQELAQGGRSPGVPGEIEVGQGTRPRRVTSPLDATKEVDLATVDVPSRGKGVPYPRLVCVSSVLLKQEWPLKAESHVAGRGEECDLFMDHESVSRTHARFFLQGGRWFVEDLGSANKVQINGRVFGRALVRGGDMVDLGHVRLRFVAAGEDFDFMRDARILVVPE